MLTGTVARADGEVVISLRAFEQESPGLVGVAVSCEEGTSLALQRGYGGLDATERNRDGEERQWKILGASRGEGGILGEGVRQALLRDPTYVPARSTRPGSSVRYEPEFSKSSMTRPGRAR